MQEDSHAHRGPHFTLLVWPDGKAMLTTPDHLEYAQFEMIQGLLRQWQEDGAKRPLVIGNCKVIMSSVALTEVRVQQ